MAKNDFIKQMEDTKFIEDVKSISDKLSETEDLNNLAQLQELYTSIQKYTSVPDEQKSEVATELVGLILQNYIQTTTYLIELASVSKDLASYLDYWAVLAQRVDDRPDRAQTMTTLVDITYNLLEDIGAVTSDERSNLRAISKIAATIPPQDSEDD